MNDDAYSWRDAAGWSPPVEDTRPPLEGDPYEIPDIPEP